MRDGNTFDFERLAREVIRAVRGRRSQRALGRALGYSSNALYAWESGRSWPTAARFFELAAATGARSATLLTRFYRVVPAQLRNIDLARPAGVRAFMATLLGSTKISALAQQSGLSRYSVSRWLHGRGQPNLPEFLCFVECASLRVMDLIATFSDPERVPSIARLYKRLRDAREVGYAYPFSHAVLRGLEVITRKTGEDEAAQLSKLLCVPKAEVEDCLTRLAAAHQIRRVRGRWRVATTKMVDFRQDPKAAQALKHFWASLAAERARQARQGVFSYTVFAVSRADLERIQTLQQDFVKEMRTIIAASTPSEVVALSNVQLFSLDATPWGS